MLYTSYLGNLKNIPDDVKKVSIMRHTPEWSNEFIDKVELKLAPSKELFDKYKNGDITPAVYKKEYLEELSLVNVVKLAYKYRNSVLLCTCTLGNLCHRHILAEYLLKKGIKVEELTTDVSHKDIKVEYISKKMKKGLVVEESYFKLDKLPRKPDRHSIGKLLWFKVQLLLRRIYNGDRVYITKTPIGTSANSLGVSMPTVAIAFNNLINNKILKYIKRK